MEIRIIKTEKEISRLVDLFIGVFSEKPYKEKWERKSAGKRLRQLYDEARGFCLYAEDRGRVIGLVFCQLLTWPEGNHLIIEDLVVNKKCREKGAGAALINKLEEIAKKEGISAIDLLVHKKAHATEFWKKQKYRQTKYIQYTKSL